MGCCQSEPELDKQVNDELKADKKIDNEIKKLLFLGSGGSGKSTMFKVLRKLHGEGFKDKDRVGYKDHIYKQIIQQMKSIVDYYEELKEEESEEFGHLQLSTEGEKAAEYIDYIRDDMDVDKDVAKNIEILWKESAVKEIFQHRARLRLDDSNDYFFDQVNRVSEGSYVPTDKVECILISDEIPAISTYNVCLT